MCLLSIFIRYNMNGYIPIMCFVDGLICIVNTYLYAVCVYVRTSQPVYDLDRYQDVTIKWGF